MTSPASWSTSRPGSRTRHLRRPGPVGRAGAPAQGARGHRVPQPGAGRPDLRPGHRPGDVRRGRRRRPRPAPVRGSRRARPPVERLTAEIGALLRAPRPQRRSQRAGGGAGPRAGRRGTSSPRDLFEMYQASVARRGGASTCSGPSPSDMGGYEQITFQVEGDGAWTAPRARGWAAPRPAGAGHRGQGRVHTSIATVTVLPEADEVDVTIDPNDLQVDVYRSSGPAGGRVNTTDSAVRITHLPSGAGGLDAGREEPAPEQGAGHAGAAQPAAQGRAGPPGRRGLRGRRSQVGAGGRSEKIRTYNVKENRVTDHRWGSRSTGWSRCWPVTSTRSAIGWWRPSRPTASPRPRDRVRGGGSRRVRRRGPLGVAPLRGGRTHHADVGLADGTVPWRALLAEAADALVEVGLASADVEARRMVEEACGHEGAELACTSTQPATVNGVAALDRMVERRRAGEPLQYVLGAGLPAPGPDGRRPGADPPAGDRGPRRPRPRRARPARGADGGPPPTPVVVDLGCGSGAIALAVAVKRRTVEVHAVDVDPGAVAVTRANLAGLGVASAAVRIHEGSWFAPCPPDLAGRVAVVASEPALRGRLRRAPGRGGALGAGPGPGAGTHRAGGGRGHRGRGPDLAGAGWGGGGGDRRDPGPGGRTTPRPQPGWWRPRCAATCSGATATWWPGPPHDRGSPRARSRA